MNEYRMTRQAPYDFGTRFAPVEVRQGYYLHSRDERGAFACMAKQFPHDCEQGYWFDCQLWKENI